MIISNRINEFKLWACAIGMVISGQYFGWNYCFKYANLSDLIIGLAIVFLFYSLIMNVYVKLALATPQAGGIMAIIQATKRPRAAHMVGIIALLEFLFAVAAISIALGTYIHQLTPAIPAKKISLAVLIGLGILNKVGLEQSVKLEIFVTMLALLGVAIFILSSFHTKEVPFIINHLSTPHTQHVLMAVPFLLWLFLGIEGTVLAAKPQKDFHPILSSTVKKAMLTLGVCALFLVIQVATLIQPNEWQTNSLLPTVIMHQHAISTWVVTTLTICGSCGLLASLNGLLIAAIAQWETLATKKNSVTAIILLTIIMSHIFTTHTLLIISVTCALIIYLSIAIFYGLSMHNKTKHLKSHTLIAITTFLLGCFLCFCIIYSKTQ